MVQELQLDIKCGDQILSNIESIIDKTLSEFSSIFDELTQKLTAEILIIRADVYKNSDKYSLESIESKLKNSLNTYLKSLETVDNDGEARMKSEINDVREKYPI